MPCFVLASVIALFTRQWVRVIREATQDVYIGLVMSLC